MTTNIPQGSCCINPIAGATKSIFGQDEAVSFFFVRTKLPWGSRVPYCPAIMVRPEWLSEVAYIDVKKKAPTKESA
jgi:hypothetical protein